MAWTGMRCESGSGVASGIVRLARCTSAFLVWSLVGSVASGQTARFYPLGDLPGGRVWSSARAVSSDGRVVAGASSSADGDEAFRWTVETGLVALGDLPGGAFRGIVRAMNGDGSVLVGQSATSTGEAAIRWALPAGLDSLSALSNVANSVARGCSLDGNVIVGSTVTGSSGSAFRWTSASTPADVLLPDTDNLFGDTDAQGVSSSGAWIAGSVSPAGPGLAALWSPSSGWVVIGDIPGGRVDSFAVAVNDAGNIAACTGASPSSGTSFEAYRWADGVIEPLGDLPGGTFQSYATGMSADGSVIIGYSDGTPPPNFRNYDAFIWDAAHGMRKLQDVLGSDYGLQLPGWTLVISFAISGDGQNIVGVGVNPAGVSEGWLIRLGETCPADFNRDGFTTGEDFDEFVAAFGGGDLAADLDGDGFITGNDFDVYMELFASGC